MKLNRIFFYHISFLLTVLFVVLSVVSYYTLKEVEINRYKDTLRKSILLMEPSLKAYPDKKIKKASLLTQERITLIDQKGDVLAESDADKSSMENHLNRPEILMAKKEGWGEAIRYSNTVKKELLYVAKRLDDGAFLRAAISLETIKSNFLNMWLKFLAVFALFIAAVLAISFFMSKKMEREIGKIVRFLEDISKKKYYRLEVDFAKEFETIGKYLNMLAKKLKKREEKKDKFTKKLKLINRQRSELISAISHEFKNPVAVINGYTQTLLEEKDMDPDLREKFLAKIHNASNKIASMIDRLSIAIKFENGELEPRKSRFDICEAVDEAVKMMRDKYRHRAVEVECEPFEVEADRTMIETVLINLLDNALKYSQKRVKVVAKGGLVEVIDEGVGIEKGELEKITKKFYRTQSHSWDNSMGLGLYIVSYILELHGSRLEIKSRLGEGSVFGFRL